MEETTSTSSATIKGYKKKKAPLPKPPKKVVKKEPLSAEEKRERQAKSSLKGYNNKTLELKGFSRSSIEKFKEEFVEDLREVVIGEVTEFKELRGLALKAVKEVIESGQSRDRLTAANIVLNRTDPTKTVLDVKVDIHPIDLTPFKRLTCNVHQNTAIDCDFKELPPPIPSQGS